MGSICVKLHHPHAVAAERTVADDYLEGQAQRVPVAVLVERATLQGDAGGLPDVVINDGLAVVAIVGQGEMQRNETGGEADVLVHRICLASGDQHFCLGIIQV